MGPKLLYSNSYFVPKFCTQLKVFLGHVVKRFTRRVKLAVKTINFNGTSGGWLGGTEGEAQASLLSDRESGEREELLAVRQPFGFQGSRLNQERTGLGGQREKGSSPT